MRAIDSKCIVQIRWAWARLWAWARRYYYGSGRCSLGALWSLRLIETPGLSEVPCAHLHGMQVWPEVRLFPVPLLFGSAPCSPRGRPYALAPVQRDPLPAYFPHQRPPWACAARMALPPP